MRTALYIWARLLMSGELAFLRSVLDRVGYAPELLEDGRTDEAGAAVGWCAGYGRLPRTSRNACVVAISAGRHETVRRLLSKTGAPVALVLTGDSVTVWQGGRAGARKLHDLPVQAFAEPTDTIRTLLDPRSILRAKTLGRFDDTYQLDFVDIGLLPQIEEAQGKDLQRLLERIVAELRRSDETLTSEQGHQVLTIAFWILAARMLRDHGVAGFVDLKPGGRTVLASVARHYGGAVPALAANSQWRTRVDAATAIAWQSSLDLGKVGPEAIGYVYESSLVASQTRKDLGTHSTPPFLVEYVLGRLRKDILSIHPDRRLVVEPACGHAAFLVAALRVLAEEVPADTTRHDYLRARLRGQEIDHAAKEMARLSLTIADVPNSDGWDLREGDMFDGEALVNLARGGTVLLANPPFEDFEATERERLSKTSDEPVLSNKAAEMLRRVLPALERDAVLGIVVPRQFLHAKSEVSLRRALLAAFQLIEICVFPDRVFQFSDHECAVILARGVPGGTTRSTPVVFRRVRETGMTAFRECARVSDEEVVTGAIFLEDPDVNLVVPELRRIWTARDWSALADIAFVQQGMSYHGWVRESGYATIRDDPFTDSVLGVASPGKSEVMITDDPPYNYMDANPEHIARPRGGLPTGKPQVVFNTHPHGRGPWRIIALIDQRGAAVPSTRVAVRSRDSATSVEVLWAICNSTLANAFVYAHLGKRDITTGTFEKLPVPAISDRFTADVTRMVRALFAEARKPARNRDRFLDLLRAIDAVVLGAYGLFAPAEQRLLSLFSGHRRPGLPFNVESAGKESRLPQYFDVPEVTPDMSQASTVRRSSLLADIDAEIGDGRRELAALRRISGSSDKRVASRMKYVRDILRTLEEYAADVGIPDNRANP